jgi:bifunctional UDP-N-acetylglucosamine pyrophosphorylase/glucosamine-1-phosphate N-acetyltransferase
MDYFLGQLAHQISPEAQISERAVIGSGVVIEKGAKVFEGAVIRCPSYIGQNSIIGNGALVRGSIIGDNCVIGYNTEIKHSYIGDKCWFHSNYIGDSVIEDNCSFGAGAITANFRLDESNIKVNLGEDKVDTERDKLGAMVGRGCRIGINASLMPGVRVGYNSVVGPQVCLTQDLGANSMVIAEPRYRVLPNMTSLVEENRQRLLKKFTD